MTVTICQLYSDIMSTYGDRGNVLYLADFFRRYQIEPVVQLHHFGQSIPKADIYIFGGGQDRSQIAVSHDLQTTHGDQLRSYLQDAYCLAVCGGYQLLGKFYLLQDGQMIRGLNYLPVMTIASPDRAVGPVILSRQFGQRKRTVVGFENHSGKTYILDGSKSLGEVEKGSGNNGSDQAEGIIYQKTIGTYLHGPILPRNPHLVRWWLNDLLPKTRLSRLSWQAERLAHQAYLAQNGWY